MNIATILFTYNRSYHTNEVIKALRQSITLPKKLYIFQDGLKQESHRIEWEKVGDLIRTVDFCPVELHISDKNKGVAETIVLGINYVLERHEAMIVLEDDCVPSASFIQYMEQCLEKYKDNQRVWCVGGFNDPVELERDEYDVYGCGRTSSWGWGTWRDRWKKFSFDNDILKRLKKDKKKSGILATWGNDCEQMLLANVAGRGDIWDVYWTLHMIEDDGICVLPYESLIRNIGLDGSGTHCGVSDKFEVKVYDNRKEEFILPDNVDILQTTKAAYVNLYGSYTAVNKKDNQKKSVIVYGMGKFFRQYEKEINEQYYIEAFIDRREKGWYAGKKIICLDEIAEYNYDNVLVMVLNIQECFYITDELINMKVNAKQIIIGHELYGIYSKNIDQICVLPDSRFSITFGNIKIKVKSKEEFDNANRILGERIYNYQTNNGKQEIVLDVGTITGASTLYFLNCRNVEKVYIYNITEKDILVMEENLGSYLNISNKIEMIKYDDKLSEVFGTIIDKYPEHNVILKIACPEEGADILEDILENALQSKLMNRSMLVILEWYSCEQREYMCKVLEKAGYFLMFTDNNGIHIIYAYKD